MLFSTFSRCGRSTNYPYFSAELCYHAHISRKLLHSFWLCSGRLKLEVMQTFHCFILFSGFFGSLQTAVATLPKSLQLSRPTRSTQRMFNSAIGTSKPECGLRPTNSIGSCGTFLTFLYWNLVTFCNSVVLSWVWQTRSKFDLGQDPAQNLSRL